MPGGRHMGFVAAAAAARLCEESREFSGGWKIVVWRTWLGEIRKSRASETASD
jgi:hypothetical protein